MRSNAPLVMVTWGYPFLLLPVDRHTHTNEIITFPQLRWRAVINSLHFFGVEIKANPVIVQLKSGHSNVV